MAKDGTNRGGARPGAGRKPKALKEKLDAGNPGHRKLTRLDIPESIDGVDMPPEQAMASTTSSAMANRWALTAFTQRHSPG